MFVCHPLQCKALRFDVVFCDVMLRNVMQCSVTNVNANVSVNANVVWCDVM